MKIFEYTMLGLFCYLAVGFIFASFVAKFELPTNYEGNNSRWTEASSGFILVGLLWIFLAVWIIPEQIIHYIGRGSNSLESYIEWLRRENVTKKNSRNIEA